MLVLKIYSQSRTTEALLISADASTSALEKAPAIDASVYWTPIINLPNILLCRAVIGSQDSRSITVTGQVPGYRVFSAVSCEENRALRKRKEL